MVIIMISTIKSMCFYMMFSIILVPGYKSDVLAASGEINVNDTLQTIQGFGASIAYYENWLTAHPNNEAIYEAIFGDLGIDILRLRNTYQYAPFSHSSDPAKIVNNLYVFSETTPKIIISS